MRVKRPDCHRADFTSTPPQKVFLLLFKANQQPLMGNSKMLCQTSTNGCRLPSAPLECWHRVQQNQKVLRHKRHTMNPGPGSWLQKHFADCGPSVPEQEDSPLCCRGLVPPNSLFQHFFTGDRSQKVSLPPGSPPMIDTHLLLLCSGANTGYYLTYFQWLFPLLNTPALKKVMTDDASSQHEINRWADILMLRM